MSLLAEQSDQPATALVGVVLVVGDDVAHAGLLVVGVRATERGHVDVLTGDAADDVGSGDEHPALRRHDDDVGQRRPVGGTAGGEADDDRDLRDVTRRPDHRLEDQPDGVQRLDALGQPGAAGVPDADDRALLLDGGVVGVDDVRAALDPHRAAHHGAVGAECDGAHAVDGPAGREHAGAVTLVQQFDAAVVEEPAQSQQRVARVERFVNCLGARVVIAGLLVSRADRSVPAEGQRDVVPAEAERVVDRVLEVARPRRCPPPRPGRSPGRGSQVQGRRDDLSRSACTVRIDSTAPTAPTE